MDDDLKTPQAMAVLQRAVRRANADDDLAAAAAALEICTAVGLELRAGGDELDDAVRALMAKRDAARGDRDWAKADAIRTELQDLGWVVEDGPDGTTVRRP
jgi:cysteinyl-tRNA synthetase